MKSGYGERLKPQELQYRSVASLRRLQSGHCFLPSGTPPEIRRHPQCLHTLASFNISSAQSGHLTCVSGDGIPGGAFKDGNAATTRANGPTRQPSINHPHPLRSLVFAMIIATTPNRNQTSIHSIYSISQKCQSSVRMLMIRAECQFPLTGTLAGVFQ